MKVETTGRIFEGQCAVRTEVCRAREIGALTAVTTAEGEQIHVCGACLQHLSETSAWHIPGTRPRPRPRRVVETRSIW
ncbi:MAG TPA: hypothetical protein VGC13_31765 [Longimicrobium sp.]|jgi:cytidine deaminase|uniref:hypothetical protein n=1 Tax=Longimicrobium sp. TaxID=2029185 RepID=UPI002ED91062